MLCNTGNKRCEVCEFCIFFVCTDEKVYDIRDECGGLSQDLSKYMQNLETSQGYISRILQDFATKLCGLLILNVFLAMM